MVWHRGTCLLLAYVMLFTPEMLHQLARADTAYSDLCTTGWGVGDTAIHYRYDANGSMTEKLTAHIDETDPDTYYTEKVVYVYNLQGRLSRAETWDDTHTLVSAAEYRCNTAGIRVQKTEDADNASPVVTDYLIDPSNPTGCAQVLQETTGANVRRYTIGHDVLSQALNANSPQYLLCDGHGSTRQLVNSDLTIADSYSYDGYGIMLSDNSDAAANAATSLLYTGQQYDSAVQQYYLRARYYNPSNGVFNRVDPFAGNMHDPQSLHKYIFAHNNPVNNIDPTGMLIGGIVDFVNSIAIRCMLLGTQYGPHIAAGLWAATKVTAALLMAYIIHMAFEQLGVLPHSELVAEIGAILCYILIAELFIMSMLPATWSNSPSASSSKNSGLRGVNDPSVKKAVDVGIRVHYDKTTDPTRYSHEGGPTQLQQCYPKTKFWFASRGQKGVDVKWIGGPHPSTYPKSNWPAGINQADFKPDTVTGRAFKLLSDTLRILYDPETGRIKH